MIEDAQVTPLRVTCAVIQRADGLILAAQRPDGKSLGGKWEFPGGKVDAGETPEMAIVRELREELDVTVVVEKSLAIVHHQYPSFLIELHPFIVRIVSGELHAKEHQAIAWLTLPELRQLDLATADIPVVDELETWLGGVNTLKEQA
jgi:8-oxo-dGTP diphosphatase